MPLMDKLTDKLGKMLSEKMSGGDHGSSSGHGNDGSHSSGYNSHGPHEPYETRSYPPPAGYDSHGGQPPLPPGWIQQWDPNSQRYFYIEQATGRTQWEPPFMNQSHGYGHAGGGHGYAGEGHYSSHGEHEKKDSSNTALYAAGGVAVGALGGAWAAHEYAEHQEEEAAAAAAASGPAMGDYSSGYAAPPPTGGYGDYDSSYAAPPPAPVEEDSDVEEAREDVEEAAEEVAEASSESDRESAQEELEEAQEDYEEEVEEQYDD